MSELRVVRASGDGLARGLQIGSELRDLIGNSIDFYHRYLDRRGVSSSTLQDLLTPYLVSSEAVYPEGIAVLKGMSLGAMVPVMELFAINAFEELEPLLEAPGGGLLFLQKKEGYTTAPVVPRRRRPSDVHRSPSRSPAPRCSPTTSTGSPGTRATWPWWWRCRGAAHPWLHRRWCAVCRRWG